MVVGAAWDMDSPMRKAHGARKHIPTSAATSSTAAAAIATK